MHFFIYEEAVYLVLEGYDLGEAIDRDELVKSIQRGLSVRFGQEPEDYTEASIKQHLTSCASISPHFGWRSQKGSVELYRRGKRPL